MQICPVPYPFHQYQSASPESFQKGVKEKGADHGSGLTRPLVFAPSLACQPLIASQDVIPPRNVTLC